MKKILFIFLLLTTTKTFSQDYRDKIVKKNGDTIICRVTLINSSFIFYHINKTEDKRLSIWQEEISSIYLDTASKPKIEGENYRINVHENKYITFEKIMPIFSNNFSISPFGIYFSSGYGFGNVKNIGGNGYDLGCSFAYKSHLLTLTYMGCQTNFFAGSNARYGYLETDYYGILLGEAIRGRHVMFSVSAGIASTGMTIENLIQSGPFGGSYYPDKYSGISYPIEIKGFLLANKVIGIGFHYSLNITPLYNSSIYTLSLVIGTWNIEK